MFERLDVQSVTEDRILVAFTLARPAFVTATLRGAGREVAVKTRECEIIGRLAFPDLPADTEWELRVRAEEAEVAARVRTLPAPRRAMMRTAPGS